MKKYLFVLILFICPFFVSAKAIASYDFGNWDQAVNCNNGSNQISRGFNNRAWAGWGSGLLYGTASVARTGGSSTSDTPIIKFIKSISSNGQEYACYFGSFSRNNSTQEDLVVSFYCPTQMGFNGLEGLVVGFTEQMDCEGTANFRANGTMTFVQDDNLNVSVDTNGIISSTNSNTQAVRDIGNQITGSVNNVRDSVNNVETSVEKVNNSINNDTTTGASTRANDFFSNFSQNNHGLSGIITSPLRLIQSITSSSCSPLVLPLPFVNQNVQLPCMKAVISSNFPTFYLLFELVITGLMCYRLIINFLSQIRKLQDPEYNRIGVLQL